MVSIDFTLVIFTASFLLFLALMNLLFFKPVFKTINLRESKINADLEKLKTLRSDMESRLEADEAMMILKESRSKASELIAKAREEAISKKDDFLNKILTQVKEKKSSALSNLENERLSCLSSLESSVQEIAELIFKRVIGREGMKV